MEDSGIAMLAKLTVLHIYLISYFYKCGHPDNIY